MDTAIELVDFGPTGAPPSARAGVPAPPRVLSPNFAAMPTELTPMKNWVLWRYLPPKSKGGKWRKVPSQPNGKPASTTDRSTWNHFDRCCEAYAQGGFSGIGFVFDGDPDENGLVYAGVDFDSEAFAGEGSIRVAEWVDRLGSYVERSVSGRGLHAITKANLLASGISHGGIEVYTTKRYFAMTGHTEGVVRPIVAAPCAFAALAQELRAESKGSGNSNVTPTPTGNVVPFKLPDWAHSPPSAAWAYLPSETFTDCHEGSAEEIRSAVAAIPSSAIATEPEWVKLARGLAHHVAIGEATFEELWPILDGASSRAPGYDEENNRDRFSRYIREALTHNNPITIGTVFHLAIQHGWQRPSWPIDAAIADGSTSAPAWSPADLSVSFSNIPHRRWLYGTYLIRGEITILAAPGGAGKTALATGMAIEIATNTELLGERIFGDDLKVLFINGEDSGTEITRRVWAFYLAHAHKLAGQNLDHLFVAGANDLRVQRLAFLRTTDRNFSTLDRNGFDVLEDALKILRPDALILDPLVAFCGGGNMNDNSVMSLVIRELKRLATTFDCAVLVVHHTRKGADDGNAEAISGASATVNLARRAIMPVIMTSEEAKTLGVLPSERSRYLKLVDAKSNLAPRSADCPWYRLNSVELPNPEPPVYPHGDSVQGVVRVTLPLQSSAAATQDDQKIRDAILELIEGGKIVDGHSYPYSPSPGGASNERALLADAMAAVRTATAPRQWLSGDLEAVISDTIKNMITAGCLAVKDMKELTPAPGRFRKGRGLTVIRPSTAAAKVKVADDIAAEEASAPDDGGQLVNPRSID